MSSYKRHEYFSVSSGRVTNRRMPIHINKGAIYHWTGKATRNLPSIVNGFSHMDDSGNPVYFSSLAVSREDSDGGNRLIEIPESSYDESLTVGDGDKLYLKYSCSPESNSEFLYLPLVGATLNLAYRDPNQRMEVKYLTYKTFSPEYSIESEYLESFETSDRRNISFNFLIAEFREVGNSIIKEQIHSGIIFMPRIFRMTSEELNENL